MSKNWQVSQSCIVLFLCRNPVTENLRFFHPPHLTGAFDFFRIFWFLPKSEAAKMNHEAVGFKIPLVYVNRNPELYQDYVIKFMSFKLQGFWIKVYNLFVQRVFYFFSIENNPYANNFLERSTICNSSAAISDLDQNASCFILAQP